MQELVKFKADNGDMVQFTAQDIKARLCPEATDKELALVMALCQQQRLNPFIKDVHIIKYGNQPAQIITGKEVFTKRANANKNYKGFEAGVTFLNKRGEVCQREGSAVYKAAQEVLIGGWCRVHVEGRRPFYDEVSLDEYSTGKSNWLKMPATMIRKVALVHCLREAFPDDFQGLYAAEEMGKVGEQVQIIESAPAQAATAPQTANSAPVIEAEYYEVPRASKGMPAHEQQLELIDQLAGRFAEMRGKTSAEVLEAAYNSNAAKAAGFTTAEEMTRTEALAIIGLLNKWVEVAAGEKLAADFEAQEETGAAS